ncbi:MAG: beta-lactamase family protein, partial [Bacteroidales bacterium]|nr:beta-lactamase family protein [Bacteroidales bacterium]
MKIKNILLTVFTLIISCSCSSIDSDTTISKSEKHEYLIQLLKEKNINGIAVAVFTNDRLIWKESLGKSTYNKPINDSTMFGICSMTKNITALAIMMAVQDSLV